MLSKHIRGWNCFAFYFKIEIWIHDVFTWPWNLSYLLWFLQRLNCRKSYNGPEKLLFLWYFRWKFKFFHIRCDEPNSLLRIEKRKKHSPTQCVVCHLSSLYMFMILHFKKPFQVDRIHFAYRNVGWHTLPINIQL